jgi:hypothetical protein
MKEEIVRRIYAYFASRASVYVVTLAAIFFHPTMSRLDLGHTNFLSNKC